MTIAVPVATSPGWPAGKPPQGTTGPTAGGFDAPFVVFPPQTEEQERRLHALIEWTTSSEAGSLDWQSLLHIDRDAWRIADD